MSPAKSQGTPAAVKGAPKKGKVAPAETRASGRRSGAAPKSSAKRQPFGLLLHADLTPGQIVSKEAVLKAAKAHGIGSLLGEDGEPASLERIQALLVSTLSLLVSSARPAMWTLDDIANWLEVPLMTTKLYVVHQPGFPKPFRPTGKPDGQRRWFADEVIAYARDCAAREGSAEGKA